MFPRVPHTLCFSSKSSRDLQGHCLEPLIIGNIIIISSRQDHHRHYHDHRPSSPPNKITITSIIIPQHPYSLSSSIVILVEHMATDIGTCILIGCAANQSIGIRVSTLTASLIPCEWHGVGWIQEGGCWSSTPHSNNALFALFVLFAAILSTIATNGLQRETKAISKSTCY